MLRSICPSPITLRVSTPPLLPQVQVTRQHKSVAGAPDEEEAAEARAALEGAEAAEMGYVETIRELLEELTAEAADCED